jgi:hypothetical protein
MGATGMQTLDFLGIPSSDEVEIGKENERLLWNYAPVNSARRLQCQLLTGIHIQENFDKRDKKSTDNLPA